MNDEEQKLLDMPTLVFFKICSYLDVSTILSLSRTCKLFFEYCSTESVWNVIIKRYEINKFESSKRDTVKSWYLKFGPYEQIYMKVKQLYNRIDNWTKINTPGIHKSLRGGTNNVVFPQNEILSCLYLLCDGQEVNETNSGLFGDYSLYNIQSSLFFVPSSLSSYYSDKLEINKTYKGVVAIPFVLGMSDQYLDKVCVVTKEIKGTNGKKIKPGAVIATGPHDNVIFKLSDCLYQYLENYISELENNLYNFNEHSINAFLDQGYTQETHGVKISARPLFIPALSFPGRYFFAYSITISMDPNEDPSRSCRLVSRYWEIYDGNNRDEVSGPGVIGKTPIIKPGTVFTYESCCSLKNTNGSMGGYYVMRNLETNELFNVTVPTFTLNSPEHTIINVQNM